PSFLHDALPIYEAGAADGDAAGDRQRFVAGEDQTAGAVDQRTVSERVGAGAESHAAAAVNGERARIDAAIVLHCQRAAWKHVYQAAVVEHHADAVDSSSRQRGLIVEHAATDNAGAAHGPGGVVVDHGAA